MGHDMWTEEFEPPVASVVAGGRAATAHGNQGGLGRTLGRPDGRPASWVAQMFGPTSPVDRAAAAAAAAGTPGRRPLRDPRRAAHQRRSRSTATR